MTFLFSKTSFYFGKTTVYPSQNFTLNFPKSYLNFTRRCFKELKSSNNFLKPCFSATKQGLIKAKHNSVKIKQYKRAIK